MLKRLMLVCLATLVANRAAANTYTVDRTDDDPTANSCLDGDTSDCSLRGAILKANAHAGADTIVVKAGTYNLTVVGAAEDAAATGDLDITDDLTITGAGRDLTIIDAAGLNDGVHAPDRAIHIDPAGSGALTVKISGVTIRNGKTQMISFVSSAGAGILNGNAATAANQLGSAVLLTDVAITDSTTPRDGGAIANFGAMALDHCLLDHNTAGNWGGAVLQGDAGSLDFVDSTLRNNTATNGGGALWVGLFSADPNVPAVSFLRSTVNDNHASNGGGFIQNRGKVSVVNTTISHNEANSTSFSGGGIYSGGAVTIQSSTISLNSAAGAGGGLAAPL